MLVLLRGLAYTLFSVKMIDAERDACRLNDSEEFRH